MRARVVVVGGGVIGVSCAYFLSKRGADVTVLELKELAAGASFGNAGVVSAGHPPLNRPGRIRQALTQMMDPTSPLYVKPRWDPGFWRWLVDFGAHCTEEHVEACMETMAPLGIEALRLYDGIIAEEGVACGYRKDGYLDVCRTEPALRHAWSEAATVRRSPGYHPEELDSAAIRAAEPTLSDDVLGGVFYPEAATLDPHAFVTGLADAARRAGAVIREGFAVEDVVLDGSRATGVRTGDRTVVEADAVVLATGPFSLSLAGKLGVRLPVQAGKGYHRDLAVGSGGSPPLRMPCVLNETSIFCTPMEGFVRYAGTMEFSGLNDIMRRPRLEQLTRGARAYFPALEAREPLSEWCGLRPVSSDGLPIVGPLPGVDGVTVATGHGMLGVTLGPVTGAIIADYVLEGETDARWTPLTPERFAR